MKATGIVRRIDDLGRIVIPKEIINKYVLPADSSINVGLNPMTFLTSGTLGIPGVCLLYSITWYQFL